MPDATDLARSSQLDGPRPRVLVIKHGAFGDIIQTDGALRDVRAYHRDAEIVVLTTPPYRRMLERSPSVDRVIVDARPPRWRLDLMAALRRRLRHASFSQVYDFQNSVRTAFYHRWMLSDIPWCGGSRRRTVNAGLTMGNASGSNRTMLSLR